MIFVTANIYSQNYNIVFSAIGAATTVDSVKVDNLTQNISLKMSGTDILHLGDVGINEFEVNKNNLKIYPNPMYGKAELMFYADKEGEVLVNIIDIRGLEILKYAHKAEKGVHKFQLNGLRQGMYFVNVRSETYSYSLKLISQNTNQSNLASISYLGFENAEKEIIKLKNTNATVNMPYTDGDLLLFRGESGIYANIVTDVPTSNKTITFNFNACTDGDSNNYATVDIGNQIWMAENLKTSRFNNGYTIPNISDSITWIGLTSVARCYYNNDSALNSNTYGALYNWYAVNTGNLCPTGWHVPVDSGWMILVSYLGGEFIAGGKLKSTILWNTPNVGATNSSGFTALPSGFRHCYGFFLGYGESEYWWTKTEEDIDNAWFRNVYYGNQKVYRFNSYKQSGLSIRCLKGDLATITTNTISNVTYNSAASGGNIFSDGGLSVTAKGVCWSITPSPTILNNRTTDGFGIGSYSSNISGLTPNTIYYVRAYATNSAGTAYGNEISFTSLNPTIPTITTNTVNSITQTNAITGGNITSDGGAAVTTRGVCWSTSPNPTVLNNKTIDGSGFGSFISNISGLTTYTTYYVRAYAINSAGTAYGNENSFTTLFPTIPTITTNTANSITQTTATSGGNITSDGGATISEKGVCWSTTSNPTVLNFKTTQGSGVGSFISYISGLTPNTTYYVRAYATNTAGTAYGNEISFTTLPHIYPVYDIDSNGYDTVHIGTQVWMKQNLKTTRYRNGTVIPNITNDTAWSGLSTGARCYYNNDSNTYSATYGALYNWYVVNTGNLCPTGWHVPRVDGWNTLISYLGGYYLSGGKLKDTILWNNPNTGATNETGYSALPGGYRFFNGSYSGINDYGRWWLNTNTIPDNQIIPLKYNSSSIVIGTTDNRDGLSVRCQKGDFANVLTNIITGISSDSAICGGNITSDGGFPVTESGIVWSTSPDPKILALSTKTTDGSGLGSFISKITVLSSNTTYYVRAYAKNAVGTAYGNQVIFTTPPHNYPVYDIDSNGYDTVHIGTQVWLKQNLKTTKYKNGTIIPNVIDNSAWAALSTDARCYYNNDSAMYSNTYGVLYNGYAANNGNLCPAGWHVPQDTDWIELTNYLGGDSIAGGKLKTTTIWYNPNIGATNESGFSAIPSGNRSYYGVCWDIGLTGAWWTATESSFNSPFVHYLSHDSKNVYKVNYYDKREGFSIRCLKGDFVSITTDSISNVTFNSAISGGNILSDGGLSVTARGVCWSTSPNPTIALNTKTTDGSGNGSFISNISGLIPNTTYYVRAYATNSAGTAYGNEISFATLQHIYSVYDIDSNGYDTVYIGSQVWMKQNLKVGRYKNGVTIPNVNSNFWGGLNIGARCYYNNDSATYSFTYGALYNWNAVNTDNLCPIGWHVPSDIEWTILTTYLGGDIIAGGKLKATTLWNSPNTGATNETGFTALPSGYNYDGGTFGHFGLFGCWWSSTEYDSTLAWKRYLNFSSSNVYRSIGYKIDGFSVRCLRD